MKFLKLMLLVCLIGSAYGQTTTGTPTPGFGASDQHGTDDIDLATLTPTVHVPNPLHTDGALTSYCYLKPGSFYACDTKAQSGVTSGLNGMGIGWNLSSICAGLEKEYSEFYITEPNGAIHYIGGGLNQCAPGSFTATANDGSGLTLNASINSSGTMTWSIVDVSGHVGTGFSECDPFNNCTSRTNNTFTNLLGATLTGGSTTGWTWKDTSGNSQSLTYTAGTTVTENANIGCNIVVNSGSYPQTRTYGYPDGTSLVVGMEMSGSNTTGRIGSITLRTGANITYSYGTVLCPSGITQFWPSSLSRTTPDGTTTYTLSVTGNNFGYSITDTVLDPGKNKAVYSFTGYGNAFFPNNPTAPVLTQVQHYQNTGTVSSPVYKLLSTDVYCYNGNSTNCSTANSNYPITQRDVYHYVDTNSLAMSHSTEVFNNHGLVTSSSIYDYITGQTRTTTTTYGSWNVRYNVCLSVGNANVIDTPCEVTSTDGGGNTLSDTRISYNTNGAPLYRYNWTGTPANYLTTAYTPNSNGTIASVTEPDNQVINYGYAATGSGGCNALLPTSTSTTVGSTNITSSQTWDCNGGVVLTTTDANGHTPPANQYDAEFRPTFTEDVDVAYAPYGEQYAHFGQTAQVDFTGDLEDLFAGLFDTPNREMMVNAGRWLSPDPAGASWNAYAYPTDPNRYTDPSGLFMSTAEIGNINDNGGDDGLMPDCGGVAIGCGSNNSNPMRLPPHTTTTFNGPSGSIGVGTDPLGAVTALLLSIDGLMNDIVNATGGGIDRNEIDMFSVIAPTLLYTPIQGVADSVYTVSSKSQAAFPEGASSALATEIPITSTELPLSHRMAIEYHKTLVDQTFMNSRGCAGLCGIATKHFLSETGTFKEGLARPYEFSIDDLTENPFPKLYNMNKPFDVYENHVIVQLGDKGYFMDPTAAQYGYKGPYPLIFRSSILD